LIGGLYASTYPDEVSGLILLDPASEFLQDALTPAQWAAHVWGASVIPKPVEAADYPPSVRAPCRPSGARHPGGRAQLR
jgi:pimeloyl-ACP methyl ester carboxylesterase